MNDPSLQQTGRKGSKNVGDSSSSSSNSADSQLDSPWAVMRMLHPTKPTLLSSDMADGDFFRCRLDPTRTRFLLGLLCDVGRQMLLSEATMEHARRLLFSPLYLRVLQRHQDHRLLQKRTPCRRPAAEERAVAGHALRAACAHEDSPFSGFINHTATLCRNFSVNMTVWGRVHKELFVDRIATPKPSDCEPFLMQRFSTPYALNRCVGEAADQAAAMLPASPAPMTLLITCFHLLHTFANQRCAEFGQVRLVAKLAQISPACVSALSDKMVNDEDFLQWLKIRAVDFQRVINKGKISQSRRVQESFAPYVIYELFPDSEIADSHSVNDSDVTMECAENGTDLAARSPLHPPNCEESMASEIPLLQTPPPTLPQQQSPPLSPPPSTTSTAPVMSAEEETANDGF